jgi:hypothetical protein
MQSSGRYRIAEFSSRIFPFAFGIFLLGLLFFVCLSNAFVQDAQQRTLAQYFSIIFGGAFFLLIFIFINTCRKVTVYSDGLILELTFRSISDEILFSEVEYIKRSNVILTHENNQASGYLLFVGESRSSILEFQMKDGQTLEINLNDFTDSDELVKIIGKAMLDQQSLARNSEN